MKKSLAHLLIAVVCGLLLALPITARADDEREGDQDRARELYEHGEIAALYDILRKVQTRAPGEVVGVDLVRQGARWLYRIQIIAPDGRRTIVDVDAGTDAAVREDGDD